MRILQVSPYYPPHVGGIEYHVEALSQKLVEAGHEVVVYTSNVPKSKTYEVVAGVKIHRFNCPFAPLNNPLMPGLFFKLISSSSFDVIHTHGYFQMSSNLVAFCKMFASRPFVLTSHGAILNYRGWKGMIEKVYHKTAGKCTLKSAHKVIALSIAQANILEKLGACHLDIVVIPIWVELPQIDVNADAREFRGMYNLDDRQIVLFVGGLQPRKGVEYLIEAARFCETRPTVAIIGDEGPGYRGSREALERLVRDLGLEKYVLFLGSFPRESLGPAYLAADLFVLPSLAEGLPTVLLEAMSYGKCVVATDIPGNRDLVKDGWNGILFEPQNSLELAQKIDSLLADEGTRQKLGAQARRDIEQNFNSDTIVSRILDLYHEVQAIRGKS